DAHRHFSFGQQMQNVKPFGIPHGCLILDVRMPGASGLHLKSHLTENGISKPIIFLTGNGDIPMTVQAMKAGAVDFLNKPARDKTLIDA
ncbi:response regulator, partial [Rhizobium ruizarguesonis]